MLTIIAKIKAKPDQIELVKAELIKLIGPSRADRGCLNYDLHQDNDDPSLFIFYENWQSRPLWQAHMQQPHLKRYRAATEGAILSFELSELSQLA